MADDLERTGKECSWLTRGLIPRFSWRCWGKQRKISVNWLIFQSSSSWTRTDKVTTTPTLSAQLFHFDSIYPFRPDSVMTGYKLNGGIQSVHTGSGDRHNLLGLLLGGRGVKRLGCECDHSPPSSAELRNPWNYIPTSQYVCMAC
jgi:hypothetical protein